MILGKRAASARHFLDEDLPAFRKALEERQPAKFDKAFRKFAEAFERRADLVYRHDAAGGAVIAS